MEKKDKRTKNTEKHEQKGEQLMNNNTPETSPARMEESDANAAPG